MLKLISDASRKSSLKLNLELLLFYFKQLIVYACYKAKNGKLVAALHILAAFRISNIISVLNKEFSI